MYVDSHTHIHDQAFAPDRAAVVDRMRGARVDRAVLVGCDLDDSRRALETAEAYGFCASAGIHPHEAKDAPSDLPAAFDPLLANPRVRAIGETGLDYYYDRSPREAQREVLRAQIAIAREHGYPLIFHQRDAHDDFLQILREEWRPGMRGVVHCFTGDSVQAGTFVTEFGLHLGIGGVVTFKTAQTLRDAVRAVGLAPLLLETDAPYLAPVPHRGTRNEPSFIPEIAAFVARELGMDVAAVAERTTGNAAALFGL